MKRTSDLIHVERARKRMSLKELSEKTSVSVSYLSMIERGNRRAVQINIYASICDALEIPRRDMINAINEDMAEEVEAEWANIE